jgi:hypothetical protein
MPGGNPYTRPANRPEREAMSRQSARKAAVKNIESKREENLKAAQSPDQWLKSDRDLTIMQGKIRNSDAYAADDATIAGGKAKENDRKANRYKYANGGMVRGCKSAQVSGKRFTGTF